MVKIRDLMEKDVYVCHRDSTVLEVMQYLSDKEVGGVPIVDEEFKVIGFVSDGDIMKCVSRQKPVLLGEFDSSVVWMDNDTFEEKVSRLINAKVMEIATKHVVCLQADSDIDEAARLLSGKKIKKAPVLENGVLVGVISRSEVIRHIMQIIVKSLNTK